MVATTAWGPGPAIQGAYRPPFRGGHFYTRQLLSKYKDRWKGSIEINVS